MNFLNKFIKKFQSSEKNLEQSATNNLKISPNLDEFVKKELVPGLNISSDYFWKSCNRDVKWLRPGACSKPVFHQVTPCG